MMVGEGRMALTLKPPKPVTDEELQARRNPGLQFERSAGGELIVTPTGSASGRRELALGAQLARWAEERSNSS
jgi:Uma2 family endonuclease